MSLARRPLLAFAGIALLPLARLAGAAETMVRGSGVATTQRRDIGAFAGVALGAPFAVVLRPGSRETIEIVADDNVLPLIETRLRGAGSDRMLEIEVPRNIRIEPRTPVVVTIDFVRLENIAIGGGGRIGVKSLKTARLDVAIGGSGAIDVAGLDAGNLAVTIGGSGDFRADGRARRLSISIGGSGRCDAEKVIADDVSVSVAGSGATRVHAETALRASIAGSGDVYHSGAAAPQVSIVGSGKVRRI